MSDFLHSIDVLGVSLSLSRPPEPAPPKKILSAPPPPPRVLSAPSLVQVAPTPRTVSTSQAATQAAAAASAPRTVSTSQAATQAAAAASAPKKVTTSQTATQAAAAASAPRTVSTSQAATQAAATASAPKKAISAQSKASAVAAANRAIAAGTQLARRRARAGNKLAAVGRKLLQKTSVVGTIVGATMSVTLDMFAQMAAGVFVDAHAAEIANAMFPLIDRLNAAGQSSLAQEGNNIVDRIQNVIDNYDPETSDSSVLGQVNQIQEDSTAWQARAQAALSGGVAPSGGAGAAALPPAATPPAADAPLDAGAASAGGGDAGGGGGSSGGGGSDGGAFDEGGGEEEPPDQGVDWGDSQRDELPEDRGAEGGGYAHVEDTAAVAERTVDEVDQADAGEGDYVEEEASVDAEASEESSEESEGEMSAGSDYLTGTDILGASFSPPHVVGANVREWDNHNTYEPGEYVYYGMKFWRALRRVEPPFIPALQSGQVPGDSDAWGETQPSSVLGHGGHHGGGHHHGGGGWRGGGFYPLAWPTYYIDDEVEVVDDDVMVLPGGRLAVLGASVISEVLGMFDIEARQREMNGLKPVTVRVAQALLKGGQQAIEGANAGAKQPWYKSDLPGQTARDGVRGHLSWHDSAIGKLSSTPNAIYASGDDLKKWTMQAFVEANAVEEGAVYLDQAWNQMRIEVGQALASIPAKVREAAANAVETVTGVPLWAWWLGGAALVGLVGYTGYKIVTGPVGGAFAGVAARRYLP